MNRDEGPVFSSPKPLVGSVVLALVPFVAVCFSVSLWDRVHPIVFGLPFNFFWLIAWLLITPLCMWRAYRLETRHLRDLANKAQGRK
jgi:hypothetical protein